MKDIKVRWIKVLDGNGSQTLNYDMEVKIGDHVKMISAAEAGALYSKIGDIIDQNFHERDV